MTLLRLACAALAAASAAGCSSGGEAGEVTLSVLDPLGRAPGSYNFAFVEPETDQAVWWGTPAQSAVVKQQIHGGRFLLLVVGANGACAEDVRVDGDTSLTARLKNGGAVRGEARKNGQPLAANVFMAVPGKGPDRKPLSYVARASADGRFQLDRLPPGTWTIHVGTAEAGWAEVEARVSEGKVTELGYVEVK
jgi:hypothetical protein